MGVIYADIYGSTEKCKHELSMFMNGLKEDLILWSNKECMYGLTSLPVCSITHSEKTFEYCACVA